MNRKLIFGAMLILGMIVSGALFGMASAQITNHPLLVEDFNYPASALLTDNGWAAHSGAGTNPIAVVTPGLTVTGYPSSGVGNAVTLTTSGEDDNRTFAAQTTGAVYTAFMVNASEAAVDAFGGYFFHIGPSAIGTTFRGRVWIKKDASNNIAFGISKASTSEVVFTPFSYALNTTYLIVVKYTIIDGATNDTVDLFVSTTTPASEPAPTISATDTIQTDIIPGSVALRQGTTTTSPTVKVDGIRVGKSWGSITRPADATVDFNGDGKTDYAVVRNAGGANGQLTWFWNLNGSANPTVAASWGLNQDVLVPADYDGDGKDDIAIWRPDVPTVAAFYILQSQTSTVLIERFGQTGDDPTVVADYNGDGRDDVAVYRTGAQGVWYYRTVAAGPVSYVPWGTTGDKVAPGDYDGDGKADIAIARNDTGNYRFWQLLSTGASDNSNVFGNIGDAIATGDFDSDGKTDLAVARPNGGAFDWFVKRSGGGAEIYATFGASTDTIAPGDYDGDGKTDIAVFRNGVFYSLNSSNNAVNFFQLGSSGDRIPASSNMH